MPWRESVVVDERRRFVLALEKGERMVDACRQFGISRKTGYKILARWKAQWDAGLLDQSRAPLRVPHSTPAEVVELVVQCRKEHPTWGARKLLAVLGKLHPGVRFPVSSTVDLILRRHQLVVPRRRRQPVIPYPSALRVPVAPNDLWCADFKGQFRLGSRAYCYPATITDQVSRLLLACEGLESTEGGPTREVFEQTFAEYGLPWAIRTDNGTPFVGRGLWGLSRLSVWWLRLGISHERTKPGHPEQNGRHERMHRTLKQETTRPASHGSLAQQERFNEFRTTFNDVRPHEALCQKTPSSIHVLSQRPYPDRLPEPEYPLHDDVRRVDRCGKLPFGGRRSIFITSALAGQPVGLRELDDDRWLISFMNLDLGEVDMSRRRFEPFEAPPRVEEPADRTEPPVPTEPVLPG